VWPTHGGSGGARASRRHVASGRTLRDHSRPVSVPLVGRMVGAPHRVSEVVGAVVGALGPSTPKGEGGASHSVGLHLPVYQDLSMMESVFRNRLTT
jgi:hypothetical protein